MVLAGLFIAALLARLALIPIHRFDLGRISTVDTARYLELAENLRRTWRFEQSATGGPPALENPGGIEIFRTPGYPTFLALLTFLPGRLEVWALLIQAFLSALTVAVAFRALEILLGPRPALAAAGLVVIDPLHFLYANLLMSDVLFALCFTLAVALSLEARAKLGARFALAGGALFSAASAIRPVGLLAWLPAGALLYRRGAPRRAVAVAGLLALLFPMAWTIRNGARTGAFVTSSAFDLNSCLVFAARVRSRAESLPREVAQERVMSELRARAEHLSIAKRLPAMRAFAFAEARAHPLAAGQALADAAGEFFLAGERRNFLRLAGASGSGRALFASQVAANTLLTLLAVAGFGILWRRGARAEALFAVATVAAIALPSIVVGNARFRMPVSFLIHGLAGVAIVAAFEQRRNRAQA